MNSSTYKPAPNYVTNKLTNHKPVFFGLSLLRQLLNQSEFRDRTNTTRLVERHFNYFLNIFCHRTLPLTKSSLSRALIQTMYEYCETFNSRLHNASYIGLKVSFPNVIFFICKEGAFLELLCHELIFWAKNTNLNRLKKLIPLCMVWEDYNQLTANVSIDQSDKEVLITVSSWIVMNKKKEIENGLCTHFTRKERTK